MISNELQHAIHLQDIERSEAGGLGGTPMIKEGMTGLHERPTYDTILQDG
jgi:hypothetical protein